MDTVKKEWNQGNSGILYLLTVFLTLIIAAVISLIIDGLVSDKFIKNTVNTAILYVLIFMTLICYTNKKEYKLIEKSNFKVKINLLNILILILIAGASIFFFLPLNNLFVGVLEATGYKIVLSEPVDSIGKVIASSFVLCLIPAFIEELVYRNAILNGLNKDYSTKNSILLCSIMFALFHMNGAQFIYQIIMGLILCLVTVIYGTLTAPMILHFLNNFIVIVAVYLMGDSSEAVTLNFPFVVKAIGMALSGIIIILLLLILASFIKKIFTRGYVKGSITIKSLLFDLKNEFFKDKENKNNDNKEYKTLYIMCFSAIIFLWVINFILGYVNL